MPTSLVTQETIKDLISNGVKALTVQPGTIVTASAAELASSHGVRIVAAQADAVSGTKVSSENSLAANEGKIVAFGSDHGGFQLKEMLKKHAESLGYQVVDKGAFDEKPSDYPDFAYSVALAVSSGAAWRGVMIDGAGTGSCVVANKVPGIRAACCHNEFVARNAREHNNTNVLTLGSRVTGSEVCKEILRIWLETWFAGGRHQQRVEKMTDVERRFLK